VLLDEPVTALDAVSHTLIDAAVEAERDAGRTVVTSTHDLADARRADLVLLLAGRIVAAGPPDEVLTEVGLGDAYGGRLVTMGDNLLLLDDPHHHHVHPTDTPGPRQTPGRGEPS
jgi:manganese transport system ATP-binding protein